jgi:hypothetical protein
MSLPPEQTPELTPIERERMILRHGIEQDSRTVRTTGIVAMALGLFLVVMIGAVAFYTVPIMLADGETVEGSRFTGGPEARLLIFGIYAAVAAIGLTAMLSGAVHFATGRRFAPGIRLMSLFLSLVVGIGLLVKAFA